MTEWRNIKQYSATVFDIALLCVPQWAQPYRRTSMVQASLSEGFAQDLYRITALGEVQICTLCVTGRVL